MVFRHCTVKDLLGAKRRKEWSAPAGEAGDRCGMGQLQME